LIRLLARRLGLLVRNLSGLATRRGSRKDRGFAAFVLSLVQAMCTWRSGGERSNMDGAREWIKLAKTRTYR
jgi:hypothetical protein